MGTIEEFKNLGWTEATLKDVQYQNTSMSFRVTDLLSHTPKVSYKYVKIKIEGIIYLRVYSFPYINDQYGEEEYPGSIL